MKFNSARTLLVLAVTLVAAMIPLQAEGKPVVLQTLTVGGAG